MVWHVDRVMNKDLGGEIRLSINASASLIPISNRNYDTITVKQTAESGNVGSKTFNISSISSSSISGTSYLKTIVIVAGDFKTNNMLNSDGSLQVEVNDDVDIRYTDLSVSAMPSVTISAVAYTDFSEYLPGCYPDGPSDMLFDGRYIWIAAATNIHIFDVIDFHDAELKDEFEYHELKNVTMSQVRTINLGASTIPIKFTGSHYLEKVGDYVYVTNDLGGKLYDKIMRLHRTDPDSTFDVIDLPVTMDSNMVGAANKLWFCNNHKMDDYSDRQSLYNFDISASTFSSVEIPTRKQQKERFLAYPYNGEIYVTDHNNVSVSKFTVSDGLFASTIRTGNRHPTMMSVTDDKDLRVFSINGMVQNINTVSASVTNLFGTLEVIEGVGEIEEFYWFLDDLGGLKRVEKATNFMRLTDADQIDYELLLDEFPNPITLKNKLITTEELVYDRWNGSAIETVTLDPYVFVLSDTRVQAFRATRMYRDNYRNIGAAGMISTGLEDYMGD